MNKFDLNEVLQLVIDEIGDFENKTEYENKKIKLLHLVTEPKINKNIDLLKILKIFVKKWILFMTKE